MCPVAPCFSAALDDKTRLPLPLLTLDCNSNASAVAFKEMSPLVEVTPLLSLLPSVMVILGAFNKIAPIIVFKSLPVTISLAVAMPVKSTLNTAILTFSTLTASVSVINIPLALALAVNFEAAISNGFVTLPIPAATKFTPEAKISVAVVLASTIFLAANKAIFALPAFKIPTVISPPVLV